MAKQIKSDTNATKQPRKQSESKQLRAYVALEQFIPDAGARMNAIKELRASGLF